MGSPAELAGVDANTVNTSMYFLKPQDLYSTEKPYSLRFVPPEGFARSNIALEKHEDLEIRDIRPHVNELLFQKHGFKIMPLETSLSYDDFDNEDKLVEVYLREVADKLRDELGAKHVHIFEHTVCQQLHLWN